MLYSVIHFIDVDFDFFRMFSFNERNRNMSSAALKFTNINSFDSMDRIKWKSKPHLPQIKDEAARRAKSHILIFYLGKEGVYSNFPFILFKFVAGFDKVQNHPSVRKLRFSTRVPRIAPRLHHTAYKWQFYLFRFRHIFSGSSKLVNF